METIRAYRSADAGAILDIYRPFIESGTETFETEVPDLIDFEKRLSEIARQYPFYVLEDGERIIGYAYACRHRERAAYRWNVETSIYLSARAQGKGLGFRLYNTLLNELERRKFTRAYAIITMPNDASVKLHGKCGFENLVVHPKAGFKNDQWLDVLWMTRNLAPFADEPDEPVLLNS